MALWLRVYTSLPGDPNSVSRTHAREIKIACGFSFRGPDNLLRLPGATALMATYLPPSPYMHIIKNKIDI